ncbi:MAG: hypothetical protein KZQ60_07160 [Candidatus Thiodiazotropha sp. (ex Lucinoma aequizonata)]|nr:hypothetical protein [Candidatus Thiodiazotropha sp. (ex Lucinoma aequizonata)]
MHYSIMTTAMTLRRLGCALCMPFTLPFGRHSNHTTAPTPNRGATTFAPLSMAVSEGRIPISSMASVPRFA